MRQFYTLIFYLALPAILLRLYWRGFKAPQYRQRWLERLGCYDFESRRDVIWIHAVSVGEAEAAFPLFKLLQSRYPQARFLVTTTTPTGSARVKAVLADQVEHVYLPYDLPVVVNRFLKQFRPKLAVFMEKELWPNVFSACQRCGVPLFVINARLSERSAQSYKKIPALIKPVLHCVTLIAAQTEEDRSRFVEIGADPERVAVMGNIKFDVNIEPEVVAAGLVLKKHLFAGRFVWIAASTHQDEEAQLLSVYRQLKLQIPQLLLMIVPRHPERFQTVKRLCEQQEIRVVMRSANQPVTVETDAYIADSIGELKMLYAAADAAFVGGSLVPVGGHNVLEPAVIGVPVIFGPQMFNFKEIAERILQAHGAIQCADVQAIADAVSKIYDDNRFRQALVDNAKAFVAQNQGVTASIADRLAQAI